MSTCLAEISPGVLIINVTLIALGLSLLAWLVYAALARGAERLDREGYWDRAIAKRRKRHHGPIPPAKP